MVLFFTSPIEWELLTLCCLHSQISFSFELLLKGVDLLLQWVNGLIHLSSKDLNLNLKGICEGWNLNILWERDQFLCQTMVSQLLRPKRYLNLRCVSSYPLRQSSCIHSNSCFGLSQRCFTTQGQGASKSLLLYSISLFGLSLEEDCYIKLDLSSAFNADRLS